MGLISIRFSNKDVVDYNYCMRTLANIREGIINDTGNWRVGLREVLVKLCKYWTNEKSETISDDKGIEKVKPYYYTEEKLQEFYRLADLGRMNVGTHKNTEIERVMKEVLLLEGENEILYTIENIADRNLTISILDDYIKGKLTDKIQEYLKNERE